MGHVTGIFARSADFGPPSGPLPGEVPSLFASVAAWIGGALLFLAISGFFVALGLLLAMPLGASDDLGGLQTIWSTLLGGLGVSF